MHPSVDTNNRYIEKIVIVNSESKKGANFACYTDEMQTKFSPLVIAYKDTTKTLEITPPAATKFVFGDWSIIYYGDTAVDENICGTNFG
jgi:hypothetical protein